MQNVVAGYKDLPRRVLEGLVADFEERGFETLSDADHLKLRPYDTLGTLVELVKAFGGRAKFEKAVATLEAALYGEA